jgi:toxin ParE1/3/4
MTIRFARSAIADLDEIWIYVARNQSVDAAEGLLNALSNRFGVIAANPRIGRERSDLLPGVRSHVVGSYRIYYRLETKSVVRILHVRHAARDERRLFH